MTDTATPTPAGSPGAAGSAPTSDELSQMTETLWRLDPVQLAAVSGAAIGLAQRKARHTVIPADHWLLKHLPPNAQDEPRR